MCNILTSAQWNAAIPEEINTFDDSSGVWSGAVVQIEAVGASDVSVECLRVNEVVNLPVVCFRQHRATMSYS